MLLRMPKIGMEMTEAVLALWRADDGALVEAPAWAGQCPVCTAACATCQCKPVASCSIASAAIIQFAGLIRTMPSLHPSGIWYR